MHQSRIIAFSQPWDEIGESHYFRMKWVNFAILGEIGAKPISIGIGWHTHFGLVEIQEVTALFEKSCLF